MTNQINDLLSSSLDSIKNLIDVGVVVGNPIILDNLKDGILLIKEIHPQNHKKTNQLLKDNVISILLKSQPIKSTRNDEDAEYYNSICEDDFDIIFYNDHGASIEKNAEYLHNKISTYLRYCDAFPRTGFVDYINRVGYNKVAKYFTEEKRITTRNFHELSASFFKKFFYDYVKADSKVLEIGPGQGWLYEVVTPTCEQYCFADISKEMSNINGSTSKIITSVRCIPYPAESFDVIVCSLGDPYFYPEAICELFRLLKSGGYLAFSLPAKQWASLLRGNASKGDKTIFVLDSGETAEVFSFTYSIDELVKLMGDIGLQLVSANSIKAGLLTNEISSAITIAAEKGCIDYKDLETVTVAIFYKED